MFRQVSVTLLFYIAIVVSHLYTYGSTHTNEGNQGMLL